ncbi:hypothetical protein ScPMuIL_011532 [Solemya velum]
MMKSPLCNRKWKLGIIAFQVIFLSTQFLLFFPCVVNAPSIRSLTGNEANLRDNQKPPQFGNPGTDSRSVVKPDEPGKYKASWESLDTRANPGWYDEAKLGIFIHWGVYSVPSFVDVGSEGLAEWFWYYWSGRAQKDKDKENVKSAQEFMRKHYPPGFKYTDFAPKFTAEFFDPDQWAELFQASGARYVVLTSKHHDGFALWQSERSWNWNAVDNGPHRDIVGELGDAVRKQNLHYGLYHSLYEWFNPLYLHDKANNYSTNVYIKDKLMPEITDLVMRYKPDIVWGDGDWEAPCSYWNCTEFLAWLYNDSPVRDRVVVNDRWGLDVRCNHSGILTCDDRWTPNGTLKKKWENCMTIDKESWGYRRNAQVQDYYTIEELITILANTVSKGGNLLMNIGPTADGRIIPIFQERLLQLGRWLKVNGEAIYGTQTWRVTTDPLNPDVRYTAKNVNGELVVYAIVLKFPQKDTIRLGAPVSQDQTVVTWVGYHSPLKWSTAGDAGIDITIPRLLLSEAPCEWAWVFKLNKLKN